MLKFSYIPILLLRGAIMKKRNWLYLCLIAILFTAGWYGYHAATDDTYEGMSIIPEKTKDIPLYPGLEPTRSDYVMEGDSWREVVAFYEKQLPKHGWNLRMKGSSLDDEDPKNDWSGAYSEWTKGDFELRVGASYNQWENQTEVMFDRTPILHSSVWIKQAPASLCIHANSLRSDCEKVSDPSEITAIIHFINNAYDSKEKAPSYKNEGRIDFGTFDVYFYYQESEEIILWSEKGVKIMKPEPEFLALLKSSS
jgi:hypothetical protein